MRPDLRGMLKPRSGDHFRQGKHGVAMKVGHSRRLVVHVQRTLSKRVLRRHACRAPVCIANERLDASQSEHKTPPGVGPIGPERQHCGNVERGDHLARRADTNPVAQVGANKRVVGE